MPVEAQKAVLSVFGTGLVAAGQIECNLFGGKAACSDIPRKSKFATSCVGSNKEVDCAFKAEAVHQVYEDPSAQFRDSLKDTGVACLMSLPRFLLVHSA